MPGIAGRLPVVSRIARVSAMMAACPLVTEYRLHMERGPMPSEEPLARQYSLFMLCTIRMSRGTAPTNKGMWRAGYRNFGHRCARRGSLLFGQAQYRAAPGGRTRMRR